MKPHAPASSATKTKRSTKAAPSTRKARAAAKSAPVPAPGQRDDMVREAAYYYYEARGCVDGHELEDWLRAESDIERAFGSVDSTEPARH